MPERKTEWKIHNDCIDALNDCFYATIYEPLAVPVTSEDSLTEPYNLWRDLFGDCIKPPVYKPEKGMGIPGIRKIYFNNKHTTIQWEDGTRTTVGCAEGQEFDEYGGFAAAVLKRLFGSSTAAYRYMDAHKEVQPNPSQTSKQKKEETVSKNA